MLRNTWGTLFLVVTAAACAPWPDPCENGGDCPVEDAGGTIQQTSSSFSASFSASSSATSSMVESSSAAPASSEMAPLDGGTTTPDAGDPASSSSSLGFPSSGQSGSSSGVDSSSSTMGSSATGWTLAVMPDTQLYAMDFPQVFHTQTQWLRDNAQTRNIRFMVHEGDITHLNNATEWSVAFDAITDLDGVIPYALTFGNHDLGVNGLAEDRTTLGDDAAYFLVDRYLQSPTYGGVFQAGDFTNSYHLFTAAGVDYLVLALEFGPRDDVLTWAGLLCDQYASRTVMVVTHSYMDTDDTRVGPTDDFSPDIYQICQPTPGACNNGEEMWEKLVRLKPNIRFVFSGHQLGDGIGRRVDRNDANLPVFQMLANYQVRVMGGEGYLRMLTFEPDGEHISVTSFSPYLGTSLEDGQNRFVINLTQGTFTP